MPLGEGAHIVGAKNSKKSPRGDHPLSQSEREHEDNYILLCRDGHKTVDHGNTRDLFSVDELRRYKVAHEARIKKVSGMSHGNHTAVLRVRGVVQGDPPGLDRGIVATALIADGRYPDYAASYHGDGVEVALENLDSASSSYYTMAADIIHQKVETLREGVSSQNVKHLSVFAFARLPLLVYLGWRLDDTFPVEVYQYHRDAGDWQWQLEGVPVEFELRSPDVQSDTKEAVLIVNVSGEIGRAELPAKLAGMPVWEVRPLEVVPCPNICAVRNTLENAQAAFRELFSGLENRAKHIGVLHVFLACPLSVGVVLGRTLGPAGPRLVLYDYDSGSGSGARAKALEIPR